MTRDTDDSKEPVLFEDTSLFQMHETLKQLRAARDAMHEAEIEGMYISLPGNPEDNYELAGLCDTLIKEVDSLARMQLMAILAPEVRESVYRDLLHSALSGYLAKQ